MTTVAKPTPRTLAPSQKRVLPALVGRGMRDHRRAPLTWGGSLGAMSALIVAIWPSIEDSISEAVRGYPEALKQAFGIEELDSAEAYLDAEMFSLIIPLAVAFFAIRVIVNLIAGAEERGYLDTLLSAPVRRRALAAAAFAVAALASAAVLVVTGGLAWLAGAISGSDLGLGATAEALVSVWALTLFFVGLAGLTTGFVHRPAVVTGVATGALVAMYVVDLLGKVADSMEPLRWASVFKYYGAPLRDGADPLACAGLVLVGAALAALGALLFERRDVL